MAQNEVWSTPHIDTDAAYSARRSELGMNDNPVHSPVTTTRPAHSELGRWDHPDILASRDKKMSLDFASANSQSQHSLYSQNDLDQPFIHNGDSQNASSPTHPHMNGHLQHHPFDQPDSMDAADHSSYSLFSDSTSPTSFTSQRYRTNASSSSSLGPSFGMNSESIYSHPSFTDSVPSFNGSNGNPYDIITNLSSGKVSPLTPSDSVSNLHHPGGFPPSVAGKDYPPQGFGDIHERRLPGIGGNGYHSEYPDDYAIGNINNGLPFGPSAMQHFNDRLGRFPPDRYSHPNGPPSGVPSHIPNNNHGSELMRGVAPHATHSFRESPVSPYDDLHYLGNNSHSEMRMHAVDETLARMKLQAHPMMGASSDLQTFIR